MSQPGPAALLFHGLPEKKILRCDLSHLDVDDRSLVGALPLAAALTGILLCILGWHAPITLPT
jgi:hypothetical protein